MKFIDALRVDARHSIRRLIQSPALSLTIVASIVLVLAANTTIFSVLNAIVLQKVAVPAPDQLVTVTATDSKTGSPGYFYAETVAAFRSAQRSFVQVAMYNGGGTLPVSASGANTFFGLEAVSHEYFDLVGVPAAAGRVLQATDDGGPIAVVISDRLSRRLFPDPAVAVGKSITVSGKAAEVLGVMPAGFTGLALDGGADMWLSFTTLRALLTNPNPAIRSPNLIGRLANGVSITEATSELGAIFPGIQAGTLASVPAPVRESVSGQRVQIESVAHGFSGLRRMYGRSVVALMGLALVLLVVGVVNVSGLLLARGLSRHHAFAIQRALGATAGRLLQQSVLDGVLLSCASLIIALPIAWWITSRITPLLVARALPLQYALTPGVEVMATAAAATIAIGVLIGVVSAWRAMRADTNALMRAQKAAARTLGRSGKAVLVTQVALAMILVSGAGLFVTTLANLYANDTQVRSKPIVWTRISQRVGLRTTPDATYVRALLDEMMKVPGADAAALSSIYPAFLGFPGVLTNATVSRSGSAGAATVSTIVEHVTPGFFELAGLARLRGRDFDWSDHAAGAAVGLVNESLAARLFPSGDATGHDLQMTQLGTVTRFTIVGVIADAPIGRLDEPHAPVVFRPMMQELSRSVSPLLHLRVDGDVAAASRGYIAALNALGRHEVRALFTMDQWVRDALLQQRLVAGTSSAAAVLALGLASVGIFALLAFSVTARVREFGIRMSVGATPPKILRMILQEGLVVVLTGIAIGGALAVAGTRFIRSLLYGVDPTDLSTQLYAALVFVVVATLAAFLPAWRASRIDPAVALRHD